MAKQTIKLGENETEFDSLSEEEVQNIVNTSLDEKLGALELPETFDADAFKKDILGEVTNLFEKNKLDEEAFAKKLDKSISDVLGKALKGIGSGGNGAKEKGPGPLSRFLSN